MATIVERPMSAFSELQPRRLSHSQANRRESIEIIDVDAFDPAPAASSSSRLAADRPARRAPPETISLVDSDSDSEIEFFGPTLMAGHDVDASRSHRRFISPRPPNGTGAFNPTPPPLPAIPQRLAAQTSFPIRQTPPTNLLPSRPVVPNAEPFAFENSMRSALAGPSNNARRQEAPRPAPRSHHLPSMGLGGPLIADNRDQLLHHRARNLVRRATSLIRNSAGSSTSVRPIIRRNPRNGTRNAIHFPYIADDSDNDHILGMLFDDDLEAGWQPLSWTDMTGRQLLVKEAREKEQYHQSYTHPSRPEPGFTFDFTMPDGNDTTRASFFPPTSKDDPIILDDDEEEVVATSSKDDTSLSSTSVTKEKETSSSGGQISSLLVCAKCLDPLILNAALLSDEAPFKRVWALRCGHLIDEKCLNELGTPPTQEEEASFSVDRKGKGKANMMLPSMPYGESMPEYVVPEPTPTIRSRLRSSHLNSSTSSPSTSPSSIMPGHFPIAPTTTFEDDHANLTKKRRRVSGNNKKSKIEEEFEWKCPVASCGLVHVSVKVGGVWGPEKQPEVSDTSSAAARAKAALAKPRGAIQVFA
ncbi:hypothetical protein M413DRAFT_447182 [Hebeloma cylindrosporum]|uniref:Uncharacterized protein n=1 Tax=Hebeloma cylindrosporum TaxID=76867 RepID=A0A0C3C4Q4_HEBCY|nr:hypothetical protein M413DRAFT_447182 [Hebeloma cylindrosporum h7]